MGRTIQRAEIRPREGASGAFDLVLDGEVFPYHIARQEVVEETLFEGVNAPGLKSFTLTIYAEDVVGVEAFNECLAEEVDASRVRQADRHDLLVQYGWTDSSVQTYSKPVPESEFERLWNL